MKRNQVTALAGLAVLLTGMAVAPLGAHAQTRYPDRPIRLVIPFAPGGNADILSRRLADRMGPLMKQSIVLDNKGGAGGVIGSAEAARAKPDGYTLLMATSSSHAISPLLDNVPYDPVRDFTPIAVIGITTMTIAVHPSIARSLPELVKRVKANPKKFSYGSCGMGSICHLTGELFRTQAGALDIAHVPYKSSGQSIQELMGGQIPIVAGTFSSMLAQHRSGRIRILAVFSEKRSSDEPTVPTAVELGMPDMIASTFNALVAPAGIPKPVLDQLHQVTAKIMTDPAFQEDLVRILIEPVTDSNPEKAARFMKGELAKWAPVVKASGIKAE